MSEKFEKIVSMYIFPVVFIGVFLFFIKYYDEDLMSEEDVEKTMEAHVESNLYLYIFLQSIAYLWVYFLIF
jgi:cytochrome b subunit of formate dehydrogenase